jgi:hypothetical protein
MPLLKGKDDKMAKTAEEIRLEKMAADPNWAKNAQEQLAKFDKDFPDLKTPARKIGIGPPKPEPKPKKNTDPAAMLGLGDNLIDRRDFEIRRALGEI